MEILHSHNTVTVEPQDEAMDMFRKQFRLVAGCKVSADGKIMIYQMKTLAGAARWLSEANSIITVDKLPLSASVKAKKKGQVVDSVELRVVYKPTPINLSSINKHFQHAFSGLIY